MRPCDTGGSVRWHFLRLVKNVSINLAYDCLQSRRVSRQTKICAVCTLTAIGSGITEISSNAVILSVAVLHQLVTDELEIIFFMPLEAPCSNPWKNHWKSWEV